MTDREKVIKDMEQFRADLKPFCGNYADWERFDAGLSLLKEQETTFIKDGHHIMCKSCGAYWCGTDREGDRYPQNFCPNCGRAVK